MATNKDKAAFDKGMARLLGNLKKKEDDFVAHFDALGSAAHLAVMAQGYTSNEQTPDLVLHAMIHSEVAEATQGFRTGERYKKIPEFTAHEAGLADTVIRIMSMASAKKLRVAEAIIAKIKYNREHPFDKGVKKI